MKEKRTHLLHNMYISGVCIYILGFWSIVKTYMSFYLTVDEADFLDNVVESEDQKEVKLIMFLTLVFIALFVAAWHLYIGANSIRIARGKSHGKLFIPMTIVFIAINVSSLSTYADKFDDPYTWDTVLVSLVVDIMLLFILAEIVYIFFALKKQKRKLKE